MHLQVAAADVEDERHPRANRRDVREVLLGTDAEVHAAGLSSARTSVGNDELKPALVRDEVVGVEVAARLGERRWTRRQNSASLSRAGERSPALLAQPRLDERRAEGQRDDANPSPASDPGGVVIASF